MEISYNTVRKNYNIIDLCKFLMAICVIAIHTQPFVNSTNEIFISTYGIIVRMAVPFFFLSSGYLLATKFRDDYSEKQLIPIVFKNLIKIVKMYLTWSILYLPPALLSYQRDGYTIGHGILNYFRGLIFIGEHHNSWHLWYLLSTIYALILVVILLRLKFNKKKWIMVIGCVWLLSIVMDEIALYNGSLPTIMQLFKLLVHYTTLNGRILQGAYYLPIGILICKNRITLSNSIIVFFISFITSYFVDNSVLYSLVVLLCAIGFFGMILNVELKNHYVYSVLRSLSIDMYLIHMYVWSIYYSLVYKVRMLGWDSFIVTTLISIIYGLIHFYLRKYRVEHLK